MIRAPLSLSCRRWVAAAAAAVAGVVLLALTTGGCGSSPADSGTASPPPSAAVGYWRSPADRQPPKLIRIHEAEGRYFLWWPPRSARAAMVVEGDRLVRHHYQGGREIEREEFWAKPDGTLAFLGRLPKEGGGFTTPDVVVFTKATGGEAELDAQLRALFAEPTMDQQAETLLHSVFKWARGHGGAFPPRADLLPGGVFWSWRGAPRLRNAVTGAPLALGSGPGDFEYAASGDLNGSYECTISMHLGPGFPDIVQGESGQ
ncbi:MAG: hypothetical protein GXY02_00215 [Actinobacteria bacterium]|nr:hypothetical protein [Actinomycetota bacterium]